MLYFLSLCVPARSCFEFEFWLSILALSRLRIRTRILLLLLTSEAEANISQGCAAKHHSSNKFSQTFWILIHYEKPATLQDSLYTCILFLIKLYEPVGFFLNMVLNIIMVEAERKIVRLFLLVLI